MMVARKSLISDEILSWEGVDRSGWDVVDGGGGSVMISSAGYSSIGLSSCTQEGCCCSSVL